MAVVASVGDRLHHTTHAYPANNERLARCLSWPLWLLLVTGYITQHMLTRQIMSVLQDVCHGGQISVQRHLALVLGHDLAGLQVVVDAVLVERVLHWMQRHRLLDLLVLERVLERALLLLVVLVQNLLHLGMDKTQTSQAWPGRRLWGKIVMEN